MKRIALVSLLAVAALFLNACGGSGSSESEELQQLVADADKTVPGQPGAGSPRATGDLTDLGNAELIDLGDLVAPAGDHWYYTRAVAINNAGIVVGQSNRGFPVKAAFRSDPSSSSMTFLGIHVGTYDDHYDIGFERAEPRKFFRYSEAVDINQSGTIIGNSTTGTGWPHDAEKRAFVWQEGSFVDLAPPPYTIVEENVPYRVVGSFAEAVDINDRGEVILTMDDEDGRHAYYWDGISFTTDSLNYYYPDANHPTGPVAIQVPVLIRLGSIGGEDSEAVAINENGQAVANSGGTAVLTDLNWFVVETLNHLPGAKFTSAVDINDSVYTNHDDISDGHVIGNSGNFDPATLDVATDDVQGFFWDGGAMYPVDHLGGGASIVADINNRDEVVGSARTPDGSVHAFLWTLGPDKKGLIQDLGTLGGANSYATAINEAGQVIGYSETGELYEEEGVVVSVRHAFVWDNGMMYDLGTHNDFYDYPFVPSFPFSEAAAINASGDVAGNSITINAHPRGFFVSPVFP